MHAHPGFSEIAIRNVFAIDANALVDPFEVRRGIKPSAKPGSAQNGFKHRRRRALSVRAGNMRAGRSALRLAKLLGERGDIFQPEFLHASLLR